MRRRDMAEWEHPTGAPGSRVDTALQPQAISVIECVWKPRSRLRGAPSPLLARARTAYPLPALGSRERCRLRRLPLSTMPVPHCKIPRQLTIWAQPVTVANFRRIVALILAYARARSRWRSRHSSSMCRLVGASSPQLQRVSIMYPCCCFRGLGPDTT